VDGIVRRVIEKTGTAIVGAEVDVDRADVSLFPLGITLRGLEVTNPQAPATNSLECARIAFSLDSLNLLRRKVIINEMAVEGVQFDTPRKRPGAVKKRPEKKPETEKKPPVSLSLSMPDAKTILQTAQLESPKLIESAKSDLQQQKETWQKRIAEMPDKATFDAYKSRIEKIRQSKTSGIEGLVGELGEVRALTDDITRDLERVKKAKAAFSTDLASAKNLVERAERAPLEDARRLRDEYGISTSGLQNMSQVLFGDTVGSWVRNGLLWYDRLKPVVERAAAQKGDIKVVKPVRGRGVNVRFKETSPLPDFLISKALVSAETTAGIVAGTIRNITPDQDVLGRPLTFTFSGEKLKTAQSIGLSGEFNHIVPSKPDDSARFTMRGYLVRAVVLSNNRDLPITLREGVLDFDLQGFHDAKALRGKFIATVKSAQLSAGDKGASGAFAAAIASALSKVSHFSLTADVSGTPEDYNVRISSDLDRVLRDAVGKLVQEQSMRLEQELTAAIQEKTDKQLKDLKDGLGGFSAQGSQLDDVQNRLTALLKDAARSGGGGKFRLR
jgi:uncharacterized protein (TIGR03545 family)